MSQDTVGETPQDSPDKADAGDTTPVADEATPVVEEATPAAEDATPVVEESAPVAEASTPVVAEESTSATDDVTPADTKATPVTGEAAPVADDATPVLDIGSQPEEYERSTPTIRGHIDRTGAALGTGRRKTAVARVRIRDGKGEITINGRELTEFFPLERDQQLILAPLKATGALKSVDVWVRVAGGGPTGQAGAVVLGVARALQVKNPESHHQLSDGGFLTRDGRMVERKKYGRKKARRSFQFSKR